MSSCRRSCVCALLLMSLYRALGLVLHASLMSSHRPPTSTTGQDGRLSSQSRGASRPSSRDTINRPPTRSGRGGSRPGTQDSAARAGQCTTARAGQDSAARAGQLKQHKRSFCCWRLQLASWCTWLSKTFISTCAVLHMYMQCIAALCACRVHVVNTVTDLVRTCAVYSSRR